MLTNEQRVSWSEGGFLVLPQFFSTRAVERIDRAVDRIFATRPTDVTIDDLTSGLRLRMSDFDGDRFDSRLKISDLYLTDADLRAELVRRDKLAILAELLDAEPVLVNTLSIDRGTGQPMHVDTMFMTPRTDDHLIATWVALEDVHPASGPLFYYPGSHRLRPYRFADGSQHSPTEETHREWNDAMAAAIAEAGLERLEFLPRRGDVFVWHARLAHGGAGIADPMRTRRSIVSHYYSLADCEAFGWQIAVEAGGGRWLNRAPQPVPLRETIEAAS